MAKQILSGNQAIARGFYEAGGNIATSYPGSPTVEVIHTIKEEYKEIYSEFSVNEKVALEVGIGSSFAGARTIVVMKHVGVNIAADPLMTFTQTKVNGGFVLVSGDDPGMASSQNEQDNRIFGKFANMPILDPSDSDEARRFTKEGLRISEEYNCPVMLRITSRLCHSRSMVETEDRVEHTISGFNLEKSDTCMIPPNTFAKQYTMKERLERLQENIMKSDINKLEKSSTGDVLVITSGLMYQNFKELGFDIDVLKLGMVYPLPIEYIKQLSQEYERIIVIEEMMPFIENELKVNGINCEGKELFNFTGEILSEDIEKALIKSGIIHNSTFTEKANIETVNRIPMFCSGCPHRPVFDILKKERVKVIGDIGCYSLAFLPQVEVSDSIISMGACVGIMKGMRKAYNIAGIDEPVIAVIGDGTFFHSGMTGLLNLTHQLDKDENMTLIILNNGVTAMTGGQYDAGSGRYTENADMAIDIEKFVKSIGIENVRTIDQFNYKDAKEILSKEIKHKGLSIVITSRPCALNFKIKEKPYAVDPNICIGCRTCVKTNCPPIAMKQYEGIDKLKSSINADMCVGCSICSQVCPVKAIDLKEVQDAKL